MNQTLQIVAYDPAWPAEFAAEGDRIESALGQLAVRIEHVGSTSVPGLAAKPVIDIQISVRRVQPMGPYAAPLSGLGYFHLPHADDVFAPFFYRPRNWPHSHHIHVVEAGGEEEGRVLFFRDTLRAHASVAREYEKLKRRLTPHFAANDFSSRQGYADAKGDFIAGVLEHAGARRNRRQW
jgi:GrpB-like predicted nucleotidyltransferase (UPF0157 family)